MLKELLRTAESGVFAQQLTSINGLLPCLDGNLALASNQLTHLDRLVDDLLLAFDGFHDSTDDAPPFSLDGGKVASSKSKLHSSRFTNGAGEALSSTPAGDDTKVDLRLAKDGGGRGENDITHQG